MPSDRSGREKNTSLFPYVLVLVRRWKLLSIHFIVIGLLSFSYAFFVAKKEYLSRVGFLPPNTESSLSSLIPGMDFEPIFNSPVQAEQIQTIFWTKALRRSVIERFNLYEKYKLDGKLNKFERALKRLDKSLTMDVSEVGGLGFSKTLGYWINAYSGSPDTACLIAEYTFALLDSSMQAISSNRAREHRRFTEKQLAKNNRLLDSIQAEFKAFQIENKAFDVPAQLEYAVGTYAEVKAKYLANDLRLRSLRRQFSGTSPEIQSLVRENAVFRSKLAEMEKDTIPEVLVGLEKSTDLLPTYMKYLRDIEVQNKLILFLSKEAEEAKLKESRDVSSLVVIDPPFVPEYKNRPKRLTLMAMMIGPYMVLLCLYAIFQEFYHRRLKHTGFWHALVRAFRSK